MIDAKRHPVRRALDAAGCALDRLIAPLAPGFARRRIEERLRFRVAASTYEFAQKDRTTNDWKAPRKSADSEIVADLPTSTARARQIVRDTWVGRSALGAYQRHVVGTGITCRSAARPAEPDEKTDAAEWLAFTRRLDRLWKRWARDRRLVDVEAKRSLLALERWGVREFVTAGEAFLVVGHEVRPDDPGLVLTAFEQEQLASERLREPSTGNEIRAGVEVDAGGRIVAYHLHVAGHPLDAWRTRVERIPADRVLPLWDPERARQTHGISRFHAIGVKSRHVGMYDSYEVIAKRVEACIAAWRKRGTDGAILTGLQHPAGDTGQDAAGNEITELAPGMIFDVGQDGEFGLLNPQRPGAAYEPFMRMQIAEMAAGIDLDAATLLRDYSKANYSGQRQGLLECWGVTDVIQELIAEQWLIPLWEAFVVIVVAEGRLKPPAAWWAPETRPDCLEVDWQPPPKYWIDPARQAAAVKLMLDTRLTTHGRILERDFGYGYRETIDEIADEQAYADGAGVDLGPSEAGQSPYEPRPGSEAGGGPEDHAAGSRRFARQSGRNSDRLMDAVFRRIFMEP